MNENSYIENLFALAEPQYRDFMSSLLPSVKKERIIGVRMPILRKIAKKIKMSGGEDEFFRSVPHAYYEEDAIHAYLICELEGLRCAEELDIFLPFVNNWGICDSLRPSPANISLKLIYRWLYSPHIFTARFAIEMLMLHYLGEGFLPEMPKKIASLCSGEYYLDMMISWYFATALAYRYEEILPYLSEYRLSKWVHNKTISKALESRRISKAKKEYLKTFRIK